VVDIAKKCRLYPTFTYILERTVPWRLPYYDIHYNVLAQRWKYQSISTIPATTIVHLAGSTRENRVHLLKGEALQGGAAPPG